MSGARAAILLYHRVDSVAVAADPFELCLPPHRFRAQMEHLRAHYTPLSLEELAARAQEGRLPERAVAVTFDDGYLDNLDVASPILLALGIPATFFITGEQLEPNHEYWWDTLTRVLLQAATPSALVLRVRASEERLPMQTAEERRAALFAVHAIGLGLTPDERRGLLSQLCQWAPNTTSASGRTLNGDEVRMLARRAGHSIGAHTEHHLFLPRHTPALQRREMAVNRARLESLLGQPVRTFAYPFGAYDEQAVAAAEAAGFVVAVTVEARAVQGDALLRLPRFTSTPQRADHFERDLAQLFLAEAA
jgi:peptidoglycan/xylan/chitin deacetylase (PgdA/CDA1 family)